MPEPDRGYLSEESKKTFTLVAGVLGALFFILQFLGPMAAMFVLMPSMAPMMKFVRYDLDGSALFKGTPHVVESTEGLGEGKDSQHRLVKLAGDQIAEVEALGGWKPRLLADSDADRLWLVSPDRLAVLDDQGLHKIDVREPLGDISTPFLLQGVPAVVESRPEGTSLVAWRDDGWTRLRPLAGDEDVCCIQVVAGGDRPVVFRARGSTLYVRSLEAADENWAVVASNPGRWHALLKDDRPAVVISSSEEGIRTVERDGERWRASPLGNGTGGMLQDIAAFQARRGGAVKLLTSAFPGSLRVRTLEGGRITNDQRLGRSSVFPTEFMSVMWLPHLAAPVLSLVLAIILSWLMRVHRVGVYRHEGIEVTHASLTRRAVSQLVDAVLLAAPAVWLGLQFFRTFMDPEQMFAAGSNPFRFFGYMAGAFAWAFLVFLLLSLMEGLWGVTPGKWLVGIRVVGTDLRPCGIGRALVRNILKFVDGFFNFLIGILMVAYTPDWQRLGDLAARTIVIRMPRGGTQALTSP